MNSLKEIAAVLKDRDNYLLTGHAIPDGDCIGSLIGLYLALLSMGKNAVILLQDKVPDLYYYLYGSDKIISPGQIKGSFSNVIFLDSSDEQRVGTEVLECIKRRDFTINIDHHETNEFFGDMNYIDSGAAATGQIIFKLLREMNVEISLQMAEALYAAIIMDTGNFQYSNTSSETFQIAAELLECGVDLNRTRINLFESKQREEILLLKTALKYIDFSRDGRLAWMLLPYEEVKCIGALDIHPEGIIGYTRMIKGVEIGLLFREIKPGFVKIGFRSKKAVNVAEIAAHFGGGGHAQAAGARQEGTLAEVKNRVIRYIEDVLS